MFLKMRADKRGFILTEVLLAVAILSGGLMVIAGSLLGSARSFAESLRYYQALDLLERKMHELQQAVFWDSSIESETSLGRPNEIYRYRISISNPEKYDNPLREAELAVQWGPQESGKTITVKTYVLGTPFY